MFSRPIRIIVGISGASGSIYGLRLLEVLRQKKIETYLVMTDLAAKIMDFETGIPINEAKKLADSCYDNDNLLAPITSGSFRCTGMVILPCSMKTLAGIAHGFSSNLLLRAADVTLKEKRKLIVVPRETPLSAIHLKNMLKLTNAGGVILPPSPGFYHKPKTIDDIVNHTIGKVLDILEIEHNLYERWKGVKHLKNKS